MSNSTTNETDAVIGVLDPFNSERERLHRQMLSSVSHDLKTPLASIIGSLEIFERMRDKLSQDKQTTLIDVALREAYRLDNFVTNMLDMAKLENSMIKTRREDIEMGAVIRDCLIHMSNRLRDCSVNIVPEVAVELTTDHVLFSRALCLVIDNAVKYGNPLPVVTIRFGKTDDNMAFVSVQDNGSGIPEEQREAIFSKYARFHKGDQQNAGTGLGLSICRAILTLLGGTIAVEGGSSEGATFILRLPLH